MSIISSLKQVLNGQNFTKYSTDEQVVGTWIDGKPLYQKTMETTNVPQMGEIPEFSQILVNANADIVLKQSAYMIRDGVTVSEYHVGTNDTFSLAPMSNFVWCVCKSNIVTTKVVLTVQYTKTTD